MGTVIVKRPPRRPAPELPTGEVILDPPPEVPQPTGKSWQRMMMIMPMAAGAAAMGLMMGSQRGGPLAYVAGGDVRRLDPRHDRRADRQPGRRPEQAGDDRGPPAVHAAAQPAAGRRCATTIEQQREAHALPAPGPDALWSTPRARRLWERRRGDADFGVVRIGAGPAGAGHPAGPAADPADRRAGAAVRGRAAAVRHDLLDRPRPAGRHGAARLLPRLRAGRRRRGPRRWSAPCSPSWRPSTPRTTCWSRSASPTSGRADWEWAKWLPHALHPTKTDAVGPLRLVSPP